MNPIDDWKLAGLCNGQDPETWFPNASDRRKTRRAKTICQQCPVLATCQAESLYEYFGIWGGLSENDRRKLRAQNNNKPTPTLHHNDIDDCINGNLPANKLNAAGRREVVRRLHTQLNAGQIAQRTGMSIRTVERAKATLGIRITNQPAA